MEHSVQHTIKYNVPPVLNIPHSLNKRTLKNLKIEDSFDEGYDNGGDPGFLCDMENN